MELWGIEAPGNVITRQRYGCEGVDEAFLDAIASVSEAGLGKDGRCVIMLGLALIQLNAFEVIYGT